MIEGENILLRLPEPDDLDFLYALENDPTQAEVRGHDTYYNKDQLRAYLQQPAFSLSEFGQMRLMICTHQGERVGAIDFFDHQANHHRAAIGIGLYPAERRGKGYGSEALRLSLGFAFKQLNLHQVYCTIAVSNTNSQALFAKCGFSKTGHLQQWFKRNKTFEDAEIWQCLNPL